MTLGLSQCSDEKPITVYNSRMKSSHCIMGNLLLTSIRTVEKSVRPISMCYYAVAVVQGN